MMPAIEERREKAKKICNANVKLHHLRIVKSEEDKQKHRHDQRKLVQANARRVCSETILNNIVKY